MPCLPKLPATHRSSVGAVAFIAFLALACVSDVPDPETPPARAPEPPANDVVRFDPPAGKHTLAPMLSGGDKTAVLSWLEASGDDSGHALRFSELRNTAGSWRWSSPRTVFEGPDFFANWADVPSVRRAPDGRLLAHWLQRSGAGTVGT